MKQCDEEKTVYGVWGSKRPSTRRVENSRSDLRR